MTVTFLQMSSWSISTCWYLTLQAPAPQNDQTPSNNSLATALAKMKKRTYQIQWIISNFDTLTQMALFWCAWPALPISKWPQEKLRKCNPHKESTHNYIITCRQPHTHTSIIYMCKHSSSHQCRLTIVHLNFLQFMDNQMTSELLGRILGKGMIPLTVVIQMMNFLKII